MTSPSSRVDHVVDMVDAAIFAALHREAARDAAYDAVRLGLHPVDRAVRNAVSGLVGDDDDLPF